MRFLTRLVLTIIFAFLVWPSVARAGSGFLSDGNKLLTNCTYAERFLNNLTPDNLKKPVEVMWCIGFVEATVGKIYLEDLFHQFGTKANATVEERLAELRTKNPPLVCLPEQGIKNGQAVRIVVKYLREHPERLHEPAVHLLSWAISDAFPCKK